MNKGDQCNEKSCKIKEEVVPGIEPGLPEVPMIRIWSASHYTIQPDLVLELMEDQKFKIISGTF